ncbi:unnamed protein product [Ceutorhynchus assimilis]|uniref:EB domain-containing protein n=1 Tax=Ceutorhynchus assimilis TaxID=467358 RepID=A0A9N9MTI1_9CUCU|nr:unnamed protein product [Ceutorhynchus assimilis]
MIRLVYLGVVSSFLVFNVASGQESEAQLEERLGKLTEQIVSYQRCRIDSDCRENSFCFDNDNNRIGLCKCQAGYELLLRNRTYYTCLKFAAYGENCQISEQCIETLGSMAKCDRVCGCAEGTQRYPWDGRCHGITLLDDFCRTDANCVLEDGSYAYCTDGQCTCNIGLTPSLDKKHCIIVRNLAENCTNDEQCSFIGNSVCREVCRCSVGFVVNRNRTACLKAATYFFDSCEENAQCSEFLTDSICNNGNCTCQNDYHGYETKCVKSARIGQACTDTAQCIPSPQFQTIADCIEGVCQCHPGVHDDRIGCNHGIKNSVKIFILVFCIYNLLFL